MSSAFDKAADVLPREFTATFRETAQPQNGLRSLLEVDAAARRICEAFSASQTPGSLKLSFSALLRPTCVDPAFRSFAERLLQRVPGLPFYVLGGGSTNSRDLFFARLPNASVVTNSDGLVQIRFDLFEARTLLYSLYKALLMHGVDGSDEFRKLAAQISVESRSRSRRT